MFVEFKDSNDISIDNLKDGDMAAITQHPIPSMINSVVQRYGNTLIVLGMYSGKSYPTIYTSPNPKIRCRKLKEGDKICL